MKYLPLIILFIFSLNYTLAQTEVRTDITENTTWSKSGSPYILIGQDRQVAEGVTLIIEPGVVIKFDRWDNRFWINGHLEADGNPPPFDNLDPIVFTSKKDDQHGGDSNNNGNADSPASGDWTSLIVAENGSAFFRSCKFLYGGYWGYPMVEVRTEIDTIWNCSFEESGSVALSAIDYSLKVYNSTFNTGNGVSFLTSTAYKGNPKELILRNNEFSVDYKMVNVGSGDSVTIILENNTLVRNSDTYQANVCSVFGTFTGDSYFQTQSDIPFMFSSIQISEGASLTLPEGTIVKMEENTNIGFHGSLWAIGTKEKPIVFTSIYDDSFGGDTNGENTDSNLKPGVWGYMEFDSQNDSCRLENVIVKYAGQWGNTMKISNSNVLINNCVFSDNRSVVVYINNASPEIRSSTISGNLSGINVGFFGSPKIRDNDFMLNQSEYAAISTGLQVENMNEQTTLAENNYWGSALGPRHYTYNPDGTGDLVLGPVDYEPFETEMINNGLVSKPKLDIDKNGTTISCRELAAFNFTDILWEFGDGNSSSENSPGHTYSSLGIYEVCYTGISDYGVKVKQCKLVDLSTSAHEINFPENEWSFYPNPATNSLNLQMDLIQSEKVTIDVFNIAGEKVIGNYWENLGKGQNIIQLNLGNISEGIYLVHCKMGNLAGVRKLIVNRN